MYAAGATEGSLHPYGLTRRQLLRAAFATGLLTGLPPWAPLYARPLVGPAAGVRRASPGPAVVDIAIRDESVEIAGGVGSGMTLNGTIPGPLVDLYEGHEAVLRVTNHLDADSSIHWHGILLPFEMDGVPGVTFPGIRPGKTFEARFPVRQSGTYWYHSHSGLQEQSGVYGPLVIHPARPDPDAYDRDYVVVLSDWTFEDPHRQGRRSWRVCERNRPGGGVPSDLQRERTAPRLSGGHPLRRGGSAPTPGGHRVGRGPYATRVRLLQTTRGRPAGSHDGGGAPLPRPTERGGATGR